MNASVVERRTLSIAVRMAVTSRALADWNFSIFINFVTIIVAVTTLAMDNMKLLMAVGATVIAARTFAVARVKIFVMERRTLSVAA